MPSSSSSSSPILIAGVPRSGTTWVGRILASAPDVDYRFEPDNEEICPYALLLKQRLHRFPYLRRGDDVPDFVELWNAAFKGRIPHRKLEQRVRELGRLAPDVLDTNVTFRSITSDLAHTPPPAFPAVGRARVAAAAALAKYLLYRPAASDRRRIVKTVHSVLALNWLRERFSPRVVLIVRHPFNVVSSYLNMRMKDGDRCIFSQAAYVGDAFADRSMAERASAESDAVARMGYQLAAMTAMIRRYAAADPHALVVSHDLLCLDAAGEFERLFRQLGLPWTAASVRMLDELNEPGVRYQPRRVRANEVDKWKQTLTDAQVRTIATCFEQFSVPLDWTSRERLDAALGT